MPGDLQEFTHKYDMQISGILHVGAHLGEEAHMYADLGVTDVVWIEGNPDLIPKLCDNVQVYGHRVLQGVVGDEEGQEIEFMVTNNTMCSSILELGTHRDFAPSVQCVERKPLVTTTLDGLLQRHAFTGMRLNCLVLDLQGAELQALRGAGQLLSGVNYIYTEINTDYVYQDCALVDELDAHLVEFERVETVMDPMPHGWGEALYLKRGD